MSQAAAYYRVQLKSQSLSLPISETEPDIETGKQKEIFPDGFIDGDIQKNENQDTNENSNNTLYDTGLSYLSWAGQAGQAAASNVSTYA